ncbi:DUF4406 domain-containing protein [Duganella sp. FT109W]|uniref:DUF4406 domain-containing protein n=1 Tax=Duganella margarita TaxID=2692170 RepID=A0ABW9WQH2_9BURK|nr:DUF4406 domain-containing protein [Duganella margarita]MYN42454.1 DUF4406 domain-containing protein [Duganella margarita]
MSRIYLAGPMSGIANLNFPLFNAEAARLRALGYDVVNPAEINGGADEVVACAAMTAEQYQQHWCACMRRDITELMKCDGVATLPNWANSRGASLEVDIASRLGMPVYFAEDLTGRVPNFDDLEVA